MYMLILYTKSIHLSESIKNQPPTLGDIMLSVQRNILHTNNVSYAAIINTKLYFVIIKNLSPSNLV